MCQIEKNYFNQILDEINLKREMMIRSAENTGYTSEETIYYSQQLDKLIYEYQCTFRNEPKKNNKELKSSFQHLLVWPRASLTPEIAYI